MLEIEHWGGKRKRFDHFCEERFCKLIGVSEDDK